VPVITKETRRQSFKEIIPKITPRHQLCLLALEERGQATANEVAGWLYTRGHTPFFNRNFAHPRLNELVNSGIVEVVDKKIDSITGKTCAVYQIVENRTLSKSL